ncbi:Rwp-rk domain-containing protein, partial [Globisporangium splendens]
MVLPGRYSTNPNASNDEDDDGGAARSFSALSASSTPPPYDPAASNQSAHAYGPSAVSSGGTSVAELRRYWDQHSRQQEERRSSSAQLQQRLYPLHSPLHQYEHQYHHQVQEQQQYTTAAATPDQEWNFRYPQAASNPGNRQHHHPREYVDATQSSFSKYDGAASSPRVLDVRRRGFTGKRKASDDIDVDADEYVDNDELTGLGTSVHDYSNPHYRATSPLLSSSSSQYVNTNVQITSSNLRRARSMDKNMKLPAVTSMHTTDDDIQTRRLPLHNFVHGSDTSLRHHSAEWLHREGLEPGKDDTERENQAEEGTTTRSKYQIPPRARHYQIAGQLRSASSPTLLMRDTREHSGVRYKQAVAPSQREETKNYTPPRLPLSPLRLASPTAPATDTQALPGRMITNASKNVTFAMLQPHFNRPLQEAALHFGVCTTLLKKICRKNGIKNWPFRRICGLHKSIASMEKQVHYFDGEQKRSYADQLHKLQLQLEAYTRTGNAPTPELMAGGELSGRNTPADQEELEEMLEDDAETKTEEVDLTEYASHPVDDRFSSSTAMAPVSISSASPSSSSTLSAVSTRVSVSSYGYALSNSQSQFHFQHEHYPSQLLHTNRVMASAVELDDGDGDSAFLAYDPRRHAAWPSAQQQHHQQTRQLRVPRVGRPLPSTSASIRSAYPTLRPLHHALPSLSSILHRQKQSESHSPPANPRL